MRDRGEDLSKDVCICFVLPEGSILELLLRRGNNDT